MSFLAVALFLVANAAEKPGIVLELKDGSRVIGVPSIDSILLRTSHAKINLNLVKLRSIRFGDRDELLVTLQNFDRIHASTDLDEFKLQTLIGPVTIPVKLIARLQSGESAPPDPDGLILWLDTHDFTENEWPDRSGQNCDGVPLNVRKSEDGFPFFNGKDSTVTIPRKQNPASITINAWAKKNTPHSSLAESIISCGVDRDFFIDNGGGDQENAKWRGVVFTSKGIFQYAFTNQGFGTSWIMFTMVYDGQSLTCYQNGVKCGSTAASGVIHTSTDHYVLGVRNEAAPPYSGYLGDIQIYNRGLSAEEVERNYEDSKGRFPEK